METTMADTDAAALASLEPLFQPFTLGRLRLRNRFAMAPMTREFSPGNILSADAPDYYARRATGGVGLVISEGTAIPHPVAHQNQRIPNFYGASLDVWRRVANRVHAAGGAIFAQLWHAGMYRTQSQTLNPEAPSIAPSAIGRQPARAMTPRDIADVIEAYATGAENALRAGFDGVEIHGAHGYLPDQFFWTSTNKRVDAYGGPMQNRVRFATEVVTAVRQRTTPDFPIMFRFSQWKGTNYDFKTVATTRELEDWLTPLAEAGVDIFDASTRRFWEPEFHGSPLNLAGWAKKVTGKASMTVGSVGLKSPLEVGNIAAMPNSMVSLSGLRILLTMFARGDFDLVALGRIILANPDWPNLVRQGSVSGLRPYDPSQVAARLECAATAT